MQKWRRLQQKQRSWPDQELSEREMQCTKRQKRKKSNRFKTVSEINIISFLKEHPYFSLDTPTIIDEPDKEWFKNSIKKI